MTKPYNLEERTVEFAKGIIRLCKKLPKDTINLKLVSQLIDASSSVGANYREANEKTGIKESQELRNIFTSIIDKSK